MSGGRKSVDARFGEVSREDIENCVEQLRKLVTYGNGLILTMEALDLDGSVPIDGATKFAAGVDMVRKYFQNVEHSALKAAMTRGRSEGVAAG
jgi:hypothetical protein